MQKFLVFGTRPEAIKMCPLVKEFQKYLEEFGTKIWLSEISLMLLYSMTRCALCLFCCFVIGEYLIGTNFQSTK